MAGRRGRARLWRGRHAPCLTSPVSCGPDHDKDTCTGSGKEADVSFPLLPLTGSPPQRARGNGAKGWAPFSRHAARCALPEGLPPPGGPAAPGKDQKSKERRRRKKKEGKSGKARPMEGAAGRLPAEARPAKARNEKRLAAKAASLWIPWCRGTELNCRHGDFQSPALPTELPRREVVLFVTTKMLVQISPRVGKHFFPFFARNLNFFCPASILSLSGQVLSPFFSGCCRHIPCRLSSPSSPQDPHGLPPFPAPLHPGIRGPAQSGRLDAHGPGPAHGPRLRRGHRSVPLALYHHQHGHPRPCGRTGSPGTGRAGPAGRRAAAHGPDGRAAPAP